MPTHKLHSEALGNESEKEYLHLWNAREGIRHKTVQPVFPRLPTKRLAKVRLDISDSNSTGSGHPANQAPEIMIEERVPPTSPDYMTMCNKAPCPHYSGKYHTTRNNTSGQLDVF